MKLFGKIALLFTFIFTGFGVAYAQNTKQDKNAAKLAAIKNIVESQNFVFKATFALPLRGSSKSLTDDYDLVVAKDTVISYLPYYGRAYMAPIGSSTNGGLDFTITKFTYISKIGKNGNWMITISPKDKKVGDWRSVQYMKLDISTSGMASLSVVSTNRDPITFNGHIQKRGK